jgi:hypothetical protein
MNHADSAEILPIFQTFTSEMKLVFADFLNPANELYKLINAARWLDIRTIRFEENETLSPTSFNSAMAFLLDYYLIRKPEVLISYENTEEGDLSKKKKSIWEGVIFFTRFFFLFRRFILKLCREVLFFSS